MWQSVVLVSQLLIWSRGYALVGGQSLEGKTIKVVTILNNPFVQREARSSSGYVGYYIDMLNLLKRELKFNYQIYEVADGTYGVQMGSKWTGLIGDIVEGRANMTLATLRLTTNRMKAVDFTVPVSSSGMSILLKKPDVENAPSKAAIITKPFAPSTWILLLVLYILYTAIAFGIWLLSPYELNLRSQTEVSNVTLARKAGCGAWLFLTGGLFLQGFARTPKSPSARILAFFWWLFVLATLSCYVANMVSVLAEYRKQKEVKVPVANMQELVQQTKIAYGVIKNGATQKMIEESNFPDFAAAKAYLSKNPQNYVNTTSQAVDRVARGDYAWIAEGVTAEFYAMNMCDLAAVPTSLSSLDFGLAVAKGSELKAILDDAILKIKSNGELGSLRGRWWIGTDGGVCEEAGQLPREPSLLPGDLIILYVLLLIGGLAALVALPVELHFKSVAPWAGRPATQAATCSADKSCGTGTTAAHADASTEVKEDPSPESRPLV